MSEFDIIENFFYPLSQGRHESCGFQNDGAILDIPAGKQLVVSSDTLNGKIHFWADQTPEMIAKKALRSNLSDLAAMGANPYCYQLCLSLTEYDPYWLKKFAGSLQEDQKHYGIFLSGGDTTFTMGNISISITVFGLVDHGKALMRESAKDGDLVFLSGHVGDAYCGLQSLRGTIKDVPPKCLELYYAPDPPVKFAQGLGGIVNAALDVSDGLIADLKHICDASGLQAHIEMEDIIFSSDVEKLLEAKAVTKNELLTGGDDYQMLVTVSPDKVRELMDHARNCDIDIQQIGVLQSGEPDVIVLDSEGRKVSFDKDGWQHF